MGIQHTPRMVNARGFLAYLLQKIGFHYAQPLKYAGQMSDASVGHENGNGTSEPLAEPEPTLELISGKLDHVIVRLELCIKTAEAARDASMRAEALAEQAKASAQNAGNSAMRLSQSREPLTRLERYGAVVAGAAVGGAMAVAVALGTGGVVVLLSSCLHH